MAVDVRKVIQELVIPELKEIRLELKNLRTEIKRLDEKIDTNSARLDDKIDSFRNEMRAEIKRLDEKIDIAIQVRERLAALESKVAGLSR